MRKSLTLALMLSLAACGVEAVIDQPAHRDSLRIEPGAAVLDPDIPFGAATSFMMGNILLEQGDLAGAIPYLSQAYRMNPEETEIAEVYRDVLIELDYSEDALIVSRGLLRSAGDSYEINEVHALLLVGIERYDDALKHLAKFQAQFPDSTRLHILEGEILLRASRFPEALAKYESLLEYFPDQRERLVLTLLEISALVESPDAQIDRWHRAFAENPDSPALRLGYIRFLVAKGLDSRAGEIAVEGDADPLMTPSPLGMSWTALVGGLIADAGRMAEALDFLEGLDSGQPIAADTALLMARLRIRGGDLDAAAKGLLAAVRDWPVDAELHLLLGEVYAESGRYESAETHLRESLALDDTSPGVFFSLISLLSRSHPADLDPLSEDPATIAVIAEIRDLAARAETRLDDDDYSGYMMLGATMMGVDDLAAAASKYEIAAGGAVYHREAMLNLSLIYEELGRDQDVIDVLELLLNESPEDPVALNALGYTLADRNIDLDRARDLIGDALSRDPDNPAYLDSMGWVHYRQAQYDQALDYLIRASNALPGDPVILEHLARILFSMGDVVKALQVTERALAIDGDQEGLLDLQRIINEGRHD